MRATALTRRPPPLSKPGEAPPAAAETPVNAASRRFADREAQIRRDAAARRLRLPQKLQTGV